MRVRCPHCRNPIELVEDAPLVEVTCPSCGSTFNLISDGTTGSYREAGRTIGHFELVQHVGVTRFEHWLGSCQRDDTLLDGDVVDQSWSASSEWLITLPGWTLLADFPRSRMPTVSPSPACRISD